MSHRDVSEPEAEKLLDEHGSRPREARQTQRLSWLWWISNAVLTALVIALSSALWSTTRSVGRLEIAGDVSGIAPRFSHRVQTFMPDDRFVGNLTSPTFKSDSKAAWLSLVPKGLGFTEIKHPERHPTLSPPYIKYNKTVYTTSVTHQLHCLYMIVQGFNELATRGSFIMDTDADEGLTREGEDPVAHLAHCFDYLRQAVMCHADTAFEGLQTTFGPDVGGTDGWNTQHVCRNYGEVYEWLEANKIDDRVWI